ncbi:MAG: trypsin-like peptidase domain-containing protein [Candidatus Omnitrophica bacterium]|nr:trypsin-like peptidase domain-containing protein [Candidatus Omnitrophota bacterium]
MERYKTDLSSDEQRTIDIFEKTAPSVVFIKNAALQWDWFSTDIYEIPQGAGSGFIWDDRGHIVTNFHVIYQADRIEVTFANQKSYPAKIVGMSPDHDLAVLKIDAPDEVLKPIPLGNSKNLIVGQKALSIGNPFGLDHSLTTGVVSALGRSISSVTGRKIYDMIQTDAAINPGNSGGPLLDSAGHLIGVSTAIFSPSGAYAGVGFAIPVNVVNHVVPQLIQYGKFKRVGLGITLVPDHIREQMVDEGVIVLNVPRGGAADKSGLQPTQRNFFGDILLGDVILSINNHPITDNEELIIYFEKEHRQGDKVEIKIKRDKKIMTVEAVLQEL